MPLDNLTKNSTFDLLHLQDGEYYFSEFPVQSGVGSAAPLDDGSLSLCSDSLYLCPNDSNEPIIRVPLSSIQCLAR